MLSSNFKDKEDFIASDQAFTFINDSKGTLNTSLLEKVFIRCYSNGKTAGSSNIFLYYYHQQILDGMN